MDFSIAYLLQVASIFIIVSFFIFIIKYLPDNGLCNHLICSAIVLSEFIRMCSGLVVCHHVLNHQLRFKVC
ncbi:MAG: hypothetical protein JWQ14_3224 [Adhaeribacter sp.]|nr:hypothetical protein [Adhaeribacter sp.]